MPAGPVNKPALAFISVLRRSGMQRSSRVDYDAIAELYDSTPHQIGRPRAHSVFGRVRPVALDGATATFALNAGLCFLRIPFMSCSCGIHAF